MKPIAVILFIALPLFAESMKPPAPPPDEDAPVLEAPKEPPQQREDSKANSVDLKKEEPKSVQPKLEQVRRRDLQKMADDFRALTTEAQKREFCKRNLVDCAPAAIEDTAQVVEVKRERFVHTRDGRWPDDAEPPSKQDRVFAIRCWTSTENGFHCSFILYTRDEALALSINDGDRVTFRGRVAGGVIEHDHAREVGRNSSTTLGGGAVNVTVIAVNPSIKKAR